MTMRKGSGPRNGGPEPGLDGGSDIPVSVLDVSHSYPSRGALAFALSRISLDIAPGQFVSLVGPSGCGKSTLLMIVAGLRRPTSGHVEIDSVPVTEPYSSLGVMFQTDQLLEWLTVTDNILLQARIRRLPEGQARARAEVLLEEAGLSSFRQFFPRQLSGGMRQRVAICRTLLHDPRLLLMDEPFGALDALTRDRMLRFLQRTWLRRRATVLFVTHSVDEAVFLSDRVIVMSSEAGAIVDDVPVVLPRPRATLTRSQPAFGTAVARIMSYFENDDD